MAKTLSNFLIGIGFDLDKKSVDGVSSGIDGVKSKALQLGAVVAGAFGIKALTTDFASAKDRLGKFSEVFGSSADDIHAFGNAIRLEGGTLEGFMGQLASLEQFRAGLATGDVGMLESAGRAGLNIGALLEAESVTEGFLNLADQFQNMSRRQRIAAAQAIGLDEASIRLLSKGRSEIENVVEAQKKLRPVTEEMTDISADFNDSMQNLSTSVGGVADKLSTKLVPQITAVVAGMNDWIAANNTIINSGIDSVFDSIDESVGPIAASLGLISGGVGTAAAGGVLAKLATYLGFSGAAKVGAGAVTAGAGIATTGLIGGAAIGGNIAGREIGKRLDPTTLQLTSDVAASILAPLGNEEAQRIVRNRQMRESYQQPIKIQNQVIIDGQIIDDRINSAVGKMAEQAVQDLQSSEGG